MGREQHGSVWSRRKACRKLFIIDLGKKRMERSEAEIQNATRVFLVVFSLRSFSEETTTCVRRASP